MISTSSGVRGENALLRRQALSHGRVRQSQRVSIDLPLGVSGSSSIVTKTAGIIQAGSFCFGLPIANTTFHILDPSRELVPIGVPGELCIGGDGVAEGS